MACVLSAVLGLLLAASPVAAPGAPSIRFESTTHDLGTIDVNAKATFSWAFRNDGSATLEIRALMPSCGCTASVAEPKSVPPGGQGTLAITFNPEGQSGDVRKTLTVVTNDPARPHTILTILAKVVGKEEPLPNGHPRFTGQSLLMGSCAACHAKPSVGKSGEPLWAAVCAMCHGARGEGGSAPALAARAYLAAHDDTMLSQAIAYGTSNPKMPGFSEIMGGPLDEAQVASLVTLLRSWAPAPAAGAAPKR